jgi:hypothetical protein
MKVNGTAVNTYIRLSDKVELLSFFMQAREKGYNKKI